MSHANVFCRTVQCNLHLQAGPFEDSNSSSAHCICSIGSALQTSAHFPQDAAAAEPTFTRSGCLLACNVSSSVDGAAYLPIIVPNFPRLLSFTCSNELRDKRQWHDKMIQTLIQNSTVQDYLQHCCTTVSSCPSIPTAPLQDSNWHTT